MVTCGDQEQRGGIGADAVQGKQAGRTAGHQGDDELIQVCELTAGELRSPVGDQAGDRVPGEPRPQVIGPCQAAQRFNAMSG